MQSFAYARPETLAETFALLAATPAARVLAGGTDLIVGLRKGTIATPLVVDLKRVAELPWGIEERDGTLRIGARTPMAAICEDARVRAGWPALVEAAQVVGSIQIRNRATLGGNLVNASPAADTATPLLVAGAVLDLIGPSGRRTIPLTEFFLGPRRTALAPTELVHTISLPIADRPVGTAFARLTRRRGVDLATVNLACAVPPGGPVRFAFGAVGPTPFLAVDLSGALLDPSADAPTQEAALRALTSSATPISNVRASREYREAMLLVLARRALATARQRMEDRPDVR